MKASETTLKTLKLKSTKDYKLFRSCRFNRDLLPNHISKLEKNISREGSFLEYNPILVAKCKVTGKYLILDGQHRFEAHKNLKKPIVYLDLGVEFDENMLNLINTDARNWNLRNFVQHYCRRYRHSLYRFVEAMSKGQIRISGSEDIKIDVINSLIKSYCKRSPHLKSADLKNYESIKALSFEDVKRIERLIGKLCRLHRDLLPKVQQSKQGFQRYLVDLVMYEAENIIDSLKNRKKINIYANKDQYGEKYGTPK